MEEYNVKMKSETYHKKRGTKTVWFLKTTEHKTIKRSEYAKLTCNETVRFFKKIGTKETRIFGYTIHGYQCTKLTSTDSEGKTKLVRTFKFEG